MKNFIYAFLFLTCSISLSAQIPPEKLVKILVGPDHANWLYKIGEKVTFRVSVNEFNTPIKNSKVHYDVGQ